MELGDSMTNDSSQFIRVDLITKNVSFNLKLWGSFEEIRKRKEKKQHNSYEQFEESSQQHLIDAFDTLDDSVVKLKHFDTLRENCLER